MVLSRWMKLLLRAGTAATLIFIYFPLAILALYAFNRSRVSRWPIDGLSLEWVRRAWHSTGAREALLTSLKVGVTATVVALLLGSLAAFAVARYKFFGRDVIS